MTHDDPDLCPPDSLHSLTEEAPTPEILQRPEILQKSGATRLMVVQALYEIEQTHISPQTAEHHFFHGPLHTYFEERGLKADRDHFREIILGVEAKKDDIDRWIRRFLAPAWRLERLESVLRGILRAGTYELWAMADIPVNTLINAYVTLAYGFFKGREPVFVKAVLDKISQNVRGAVSLEAPMDEVPEASVNEAEVEVPMDDASLDEVPTDEDPIDDTPVDDTPVDDTLMDEVPADCSTDASIDVPAV